VLDNLVAVGDWTLAAILVVLAVAARRRRKATWYVAASLVAVATATLVWSKRVEPRFIEVTHASLPLGDTPIRIAVLADLHAGRSSADLLEKVVRLTNEEQPDVVLLAGDYISGYDYDLDDRGPKLQGLRGLVAKRGVFAVLGNHDCEPHGEETPRRDRITKALVSFGYRVLRNEAVPLAPDLWLVGVDEVQAGADDAPLAFRGVPASAHRIALAHDWHALDADVRFELGFVAHTHGGQVCIPFTSVCASRSRDEPYVRGLHAWKRGGVLYVNRGIGASKIPVRLGSRPEITVFELGRTLTPGPSPGGRGEEN
jgi:uncharacterized protein